MSWVASTWRRNSHRPASACEPFQMANWHSRSTSAATRTVGRSSRWRRASTRGRLLTSVRPAADLRRSTSSATELRKQRMGGMEESIRDATPGDAEQIAAIYNHFILTSTITFEEETVTAAEMARRVTEVQSGSLPWLVAARGAQVTGFAYAHKWKVR